MTRKLKSYTVYAHNAGDLLMVNFAYSTIRASNSKRALQIARKRFYKHPVVVDGVTLKR